MGSGGKRANSGRKKALIQKDVVSFRVPKPIKADFKKLALDLIKGLQNKDLNI